MNMVAQKVVWRPDVVEDSDDLQVDKKTVLVEEKVAGKEQEGKECEYN